MANQCWFFPFRLRKPNYNTVLTDAKSRLDVLCQNQFANIAKELFEQDPYQYSRAYSPGLQEFVEALTYYFYLSGEKWENWVDLQKRLTYTEEPKEITEAATDDEKAEEEISQANPIVGAPGEKPAAKHYHCLVQPIEYILGLADLGGEVMRRCVSSLGSGDIEACVNGAKFMQNLYTCYMGMGNARHRDMGQKIHTLRQSVMKTEQVCYNIKVRGGEAAIWGADGTDKGAADDDEGYANY